MMDKALIGIKTQAESNKDFYYSTWSLQSNPLNKIKLDQSNTFGWEEFTKGEEFLLVLNNQNQPICGKNLKNIKTR